MIRIATVNDAIHKYELLTGRKNITAQSVYNKLGYEDDNELHLSKRMIVTRQQ